MTKIRLGKSITSLFVATPLGLDRSKAEGLLVTRKNGYLQVFKGEGVVFGVYTNGSYSRMYQMDGKKVESVTPQGVIVYGNAKAKVA